MRESESNSRTVSGPPSCKYFSRGLLADMKLASNRWLGIRSVSISVRPQDRAFTKSDNDLSVQHDQREFRSIDSYIYRWSKSESGIPHSLSCLTDENVGLGPKRPHAVFYGAERLFACHAVLLSVTTPPSRLPMSEIFPKLNAIIGRPLHAIVERSTQSVQCHQAFNNANDVRSRRGSVNKAKGAMLDGLSHVRNLLALCRDNKGR